MLTTTSKPVQRLPHIDFHMFGAMGFISLDDIRRVFAEVAPQIPVKYRKLPSYAFHEVDEVCLQLTNELPSNTHSVRCRIKMAGLPIGTSKSCSDDSVRIKGVPGPSQNVRNPLQPDRAGRLCSERERSNG